MLQLNIWCSLWWAYVPKTCRAKNTSVKLPYCMKLAFHIISRGRCTVKQPSWCIFLWYPSLFLSFILSVCTLCMCCHSSHTLCFASDLCWSLCHALHHSNGFMFSIFFLRCMIPVVLVQYQRIFCVLHNTVEHNYISSSSTLGLQLHVSALYVGHLQVVTWLLE